MLEPTKGSQNKVRQQGRTFIGKVAQRAIPYGRYVGSHPAAHHVCAAPGVRKVRGAAQKDMLRLIPAATAGGTHSRGCPVGVRKSRGQAKPHSPALLAPSRRLRMFAQRREPVGHRK